MKHCKSYIFFLVALLITLSSCQKKPVASFTTGKDVYAKGEEITVSNTSTDAYFYAWALKGPNEARSEEKEPSFYLTQAGNYQLSLSCYSKYGKFISKDSKAITVNEYVGQYIFYTDDLGSTFTSAKVFIDDTYVGTITQNYYSAPGCGATGCVTTGIRDGIHDIRVTFYPSSFSKAYYNISLTGSGCGKFYISI